MYYEPLTYVKLDSHGQDTEMSEGGTDQKATDIDLATSALLPSAVLIRATDGKGKGKDKKLKISTVVAVEDLAQFYGRYQSVCKDGMTELRRRDKTKKKKAKKKKKIATTSTPTV